MPIARAIARRRRSPSTAASSSRRDAALCQVASVSRHCARRSLASSASRRARTRGARGGRSVSAGPTHTTRSRLQCGRGLVSSSPLECDRCVCPEARRERSSGAGSHSRVGFGWLGFQVVRDLVGSGCGRPGDQRADGSTCTMYTAVCMSHIYMYQSKKGNKAIKISIYHQRYIMHISKFKFQKKGYYLRPVEDSQSV